MPTCADCAHGMIAMHSSKDKCSHVNNARGYHPHALRHDETLCGTAALWFTPKPAPSAVFKASDASQTK